MIGAARGTGGRERARERAGERGKGWDVNSARWGAVSNKSKDGIWNKGADGAVFACSPASSSSASPRPGTSDLAA